MFSWKCLCAVSRRRVNWPWMLSFWMCIRTAMVWSWCLTSPSSGRWTKTVSISILHHAELTAALFLQNVCFVWTNRTYNYILRELPKVPNHVPVCVLGNYRDMGEHRVILPDDIRDFIAGLNRLDHYSQHKHVNWHILCLNIHPWSYYKQFISLKSKCLCALSSK